tara:strand:+ start:1154 stop:1432 length:279 start_codon:yes stop_codon:yes gene_type:complete
MGTEISYAMTEKEVALTRCGECNQVILNKGIPVPAARRGKWKILDRMQVGDSLITTTEKECDRVRRAMYDRGIKYRSRKESNGTGWRIWRIE